MSGSQPANPCKHGAASAVVIAGKCSWSCDCTGVPWSGTYCERTLPLPAPPRTPARLSIRAVGLRQARVVQSLSS